MYIKKTVIATLVVQALVIQASAANTDLCDLPSSAPKPESCSTGLNANILDTEIPDETENQDLFIPRAKLETNAEKVFIEIGSRSERLYNDGNHEDYSATDKWYGNSLDISSTIGEKQIRLRFEKGSEERTEYIQQTNFKRRPPRPDMNVEFDTSGLDIEVTDTNYPKQTIVDFNVTVRNGGSKRIERSFSLSCNGSCSHEESFTPQSGDEAEVEAIQKYNSLISDKRTKFANYGGAPSIEKIATAKDKKEKIPVGGIWKTHLMGVSAKNFDEGDIENVNFTSDGEKIGEWRNVSGERISVDLYLELDSAPGNIIDIHTFNFSESEVSGGLGTEIPITYNLELESGEVLSKELTTVEVVEDNKAPQLQLGHLGVFDVNSTHADIYFDYSENLQDQVNCEAYLKSSNEFLGDCSSTFESPPGGEGRASPLWKFPEGTNKIPTIELRMDDGAGNSKVRELGTFLRNSSGILESVEKNGDPREKINLVAIGHEMTVTETETALNQRLNWYFNENDMSIHGKYRDFFNWYILDTNNQVCAEDLGWSSDTDDCPFVYNSRSSITQSDELKGGRTAFIVMSSDSFRSYAGGVMTVIADQEPGGDPNVFGHELGHLIWGFADEYAYSFESSYSGAWSTEFFRDSDESPSYDVQNYTNTFRDEEHCNSKMNSYYSELSPSDCWYQDGGTRDIYTVKNSEGKSLMYWNDPSYYQTHEKRIKYLIEQSPIFQGVVQ